MHLIGFQLSQHKHSTDSNVYIYFNVSDLFPFKVRVVVRITNQSWHDDLYYPGSARYNAMTKDITNNVSEVYFEDKADLLCSIR